MKCCNRMKCKMNCYLYDKPFLKEKALRDPQILGGSISHFKCKMQMSRR